MCLSRSPEAFVGLRTWGRDGCLSLKDPTPGVCPTKFFEVSTTTEFEDRPFVPEESISGLRSLPVTIPKVIE